METRLAEGEIKQPHVTQIPTLKNLLVVLAGVLHNHEFVLAELGEPGSAGGTGLMWGNWTRAGGLGLGRGLGIGWGDWAQMRGLGGAGLAEEGVPGRRLKCLGLTSLVWGFLWHS